MTTTTNLADIRKYPKLFTWGAIGEILDIGDVYTIVRYTRPDAEVLFHIYVDGKDTSIGAESLEGALVLAIGYRKLGISEGPAMARAACKILNVR